VHLDIIKVFHSPTDAQVNCLKNSFKIYMKIDIKTAPTCFGAVTPSSRSALLVLAEVTFVKIANQNTSVCGDVAAYISGSLLVCVRCTVRK
jgi:riboflavin transporter FmnP